MSNQLLNLALSVIQIGEGLTFDGYTLAAAPQTNVVSSVLAPAGESLTLAGNGGSGGSIVLGSSQTISFTGTIQGLRLNTAVKSGSYTIDTSDYLILYTGAGGGTFTLPAVSGNTGRVFVVKNRGTGALTVARSGSDEIFTTTNVSSFSLAVGLGATFICDGTYWVVTSMVAGTITD